MTIQTGATLPDIELLKWTGDEMLRQPSNAIVADGKTMIVGVVGAFTPVCAGSHLKDYIPIVPTLLGAGTIDRFLCIAVVDPFVMYAWGQDMGAAGKVEMWSDPYGEFSKALGITADLTAIGLGVRSGRYSMVLNNGVVETLNVETDPTIVSVSGADAMREHLNA